MGRKPLVKFDFDPFQIAGVSKRSIPDDLFDDILDEVSNYVKEQVLSKVGDGESPVGGRGTFEKLDKDYAKKEHGGNRTAKLELDGDLLDSVQIIRSGSKLRLTVGDDQQPKADGHNNFTGQSKLPTRRFIPFERDGESFDDEILKEIKSIVRDALPEDKNGEE